MISQKSKFSAVLFSAGFDRFFCQAPIEKSPRPPTFPEYFFTVSSLFATPSSAAFSI
jgi:hypothetical protein